MPLSSTTSPFDPLFSLSHYLPNLHLETSLKRQLVSEESTFTERDLEEQTVKEMKTMKLGTFLLRFLCKMIVSSVMTSINL